MKSGVADMVNTGGRQGGAITAALFLKQVMPLIIVLVLFFPLKRNTWHIAFIVLMENCKNLFRLVNGQGHGSNLVPSHAVVKPRLMCFSAQCLRLHPLSISWGI